MRKLSTQLRHAETVLSRGSPHDPSNHDTSERQKHAESERDGRVSEMAARLRGAICAGAWDRVDGLVSLEAAATEDVASLRLALHWAAMNGAPARVISRLVDSNPAGLNKSDIDGATALMIACDCGHVETATALLRCDPPADAEPTDARGWTALMRAARTGSTEVVDAIIESWRRTRGTEDLAALVSFGSRDGRCAADWAEVYHHHDLAARLRTLAPGVSSSRARAKTNGLVVQDDDAPADGALGLAICADGGMLPRLTESIPPASQRAPGAAAGPRLADGFAELLVRAVHAKSGEKGLAPVAEWLGQLLAHVTAAQSTSDSDAGQYDVPSAGSGALAKQLGERFDALEERTESLRAEGAVHAARLDETTTCLQEVWQSAATELRDDIRSTRRWAERAFLAQDARTGKVEDHALRLHQALDRAGIEVALSNEEAAQLAAEQAAAATAIQQRYRRFVVEKTAAEQRQAAGAIQRAWRVRKTDALSKVAGEMPKWSVTDVSCWLRGVVGLGQYCEFFESEHVDGAVLMLLGKAELVELGVASALHSARILAAVGQLNQQLRMDIAGEAEILVRAKGERQQAALDPHPKKKLVKLAAQEEPAVGVSRQRSDEEVATIATNIAIGAASAAFAQQAHGGLVEDEQAAAARIQSMQRGKQARRELQEQRRAATRIAAVQRGKQGRRNVRALRQIGPEPEPEPTSEPEPAPEIAHVN